MRNVEERAEIGRHDPCPFGPVGSLDGPVRASVVHGLAPVFGWALARGSRRVVEILVDGRTGCCRDRATGPSGCGGGLPVGGWARARGLSSRGGLVALRQRSPLVGLYGDQRCRDHSVGRGGGPGRQLGHGPVLRPYLPRTGSGRGQARLAEASCPCWPARNVAASFSANSRS